MSIKFDSLATRKLKDGTLTGMITFPAGTDRVALLRLEEGGIIGHEQAEVRPDSDSLNIAEIRNGIDQITAYIDRLPWTMGNCKPKDLPCAYEIPESEKMEGAE